MSWRCSCRALFQRAGIGGQVRGDFAMNVNGAREDSNCFLLDGVYNGDPKLNGAAITSPVDGIREFEVAHLPLRCLVRRAMPAGRSTWC